MIDYEVGRLGPCFVRLDLVFVLEARQKIVTDSLVSLKGDGFLPTFYYDLPLIKYKET